MNDMRKHAPGYVPERRRGRLLHRVRVEGDKTRRVTIPVGPDHPDFWNHYYAAREGGRHDAPPPPKPAARTLRDMLDGYLDWLASQVAAGNKSPHTLSQRRSLFARICAMPGEAGELTMGDYDPDLPAAAMLHVQDCWGAVTSQADNGTKALRAAYDWGLSRGWCRHNPAAGIRNIHRNRGGATPWTRDDMHDFFRHHPEGTTARLWLILAAFTGARIDDQTNLGRRHETLRDGIRWIEWQPAKKGSAFVSIPMFPQLFDATRATPIVGPTYLLNDRGQPFKTGAVLGMRVQRWTAEAGLHRRSSHGLRKALAELLAESGANEHGIMSILAHTSPKTAAIYTKGAERSRLARQAFAAIGDFRIV